MVTVYLEIPFQAQVTDRDGGRPCEFHLYAPSGERLPWLEDYVADHEKLEQSVFEQIEEAERKENLESYVDGLIDARAVR